MSYICFNCPKGVVKEDKDVTLYYCGYDNDKHELIVSEDSSEAKNISSGFYIDAEMDFLKFHFKNEPIMKYAKKSY